MVLINNWTNSFFSALEERNWDAFVGQGIRFFELAVAIVVLHTYRLYTSQWLEIRWRRWMTQHYVARWLQDATHYRMQFGPEVADNPDHRIADDIRLFIERTLTLGMRLLSAVVTLGTFAVILWMLSAAAPLTIFGRTIAVPGYILGLHCFTPVSEQS